MRQANGKRNDEKDATSEPKPSAASAIGKGTRATPWTLKSPSLASEFTAFRDEQLDPPALLEQSHAGEVTN
jgi:hypothetical protein